MVMTILIIVINGNGHCEVTDAADDDNGYHMWWKYY